MALGSDMGLALPPCLRAGGQTGKMSLEYSHGHGSKARTPNEHPNPH